MEVEQAQTYRICCIGQYPPPQAIAALEVSLSPHLQYFPLYSSI